MLMILNSVWKVNKSGFRIFGRFSAVKINFYVEIVCENLQLLHSAFFLNFLALVFWTAMNFYIGFQQE